MNEHVDAIIVLQATKSCWSVSDSRWPGLPAGRGDREMTAHHLTDALTMVRESGVRDPKTPRRVVIGYLDEDEPDLRWLLPEGYVVESLPDEYREHERRERAAEQTHSNPTFGSW